MRADGDRRTDVGGAGQGRLSIVIATRNRRERLLETLEILTALPERPEIIIVDDASSDGTAAEVATAHPGVRVIRLDESRGAAARNVGVAAARGRYVAFSDDDSWWEPGALARAADFFDRHPRLALLSARIVVEPEGDIDPVSHKMAEAPLGHPDDLPGPSILGHLACAVVVRPEAFLAVGGYSLLLRFGGEEQLLALDLATAGWGQSYVEDIVAHHEPSSLREPWAERWARYRRNDTLVCWMRRPLRAALSQTAGFLADAVREPVARAALGELVVLIPHALRQRAVVPPDVERAVRRLA